MNLEILKNERLIKNVIFTAKFFAIFIFTYFIVLGSPIEPYLDWMAQIQGFLTGETVDGNKLLIKGTAFVITNSCTGFVSTAILASIIFSLRRPEIKKKIVIFLAGAIILFFVNIIRIYLVLIAARVFDVYAAETLHVISWFAMSTAVLILWYKFTQKITKNNNFSELL